MLGDMSMVYKTETTDLMRPKLKAWMDQFRIILEQPVQSEDPDDWSIRAEVLNCLNQFVKNFPRLAESEFESIVGPLWQTFVSTLSVHVRSSVEGVEDPYDERYDSNGSDKSLDSFVIQFFEFLLTIIGSARVGKVVANNVRELVYHTIAFLQITDKQIFISAAKFSSMIRNEILEHVISSAIQTVSMNIPPAVKVGACRALSQISPETNKGIMQSHMMSLFSSLIDLLYQASDESLHLVLETLEAVAKACESDYDFSKTCKKTCSLLLQLNVYGLLVL